MDIADRILYKARTGPKQHGLHPAGGEDIAVVEHDLLLPGAKAGGKLRFSGGV